MQIIKLAFSGLLLWGLTSSCNIPENHRIKSGGPEVVTFRALPFELSDVHLLDGPFKHATELNAKTLLAYEPDRFLSKFRIEAGLTPKAGHYHGWEDNTLAGHSLGHYLSACSMMFLTTGDTAFLDRVNYIIDELALCQETDGDGYIGAFPGGKRILEEEVARGDIRAKGFDLNGIWSPFYTEHKVLAGLLDAYRLCGNKKALEISIHFTGWLERVVSGLDDSQVQEMLRCEHGGMNEALAELYALTGDERYLRMSRIFHHKAILDSLAMGFDILAGKHGNTQIPKLIGLARRYELTGDITDRRTAEFFWDRVVYHHSYVTGGHGNNEYFGQADSLSHRLSDQTAESCNVYNMLKLSGHLFGWEASAEVADFYERALFNHILSSQHPLDGRVTYFISLEPGGCKSFQDPFEFTCCIGTGMENHSKYGANIFFHNDEELFVSQFIASELNWQDKGVRIKQITSYPEEQGTTLEFACSEPARFTLQIRYPCWAADGMKLYINGKKRQVLQQPDSFVPVRRTWKTGDRVEVKIPFTLHLESMPDDSNLVAVMYGPLVLAGDLGPEDDPSACDPSCVPVLVTADRDPARWTEPVEGVANTFRTVNTGKPGDIVLKPFYTFYNRRYTVYWDMVSTQQ